VAANANGLQTRRRAGGAVPPFIGLAAFLVPANLLLNEQAQQAKPPAVPSNRANESNTKPRCLLMDSTELEIALRELTLDRPAPEFIGGLEDPSELDPQLARNALKPRDLTPLRAGQPLRCC
jgi:hypothetical protein